MAWDFSTDPELQQKLDWMTEFVSTEIEPLDLAFSSHLVYDKDHPVHEKAVRPLQDEVRARDLWACHLGPDLGGKGYGQRQLALINGEKWFSSNLRYAKFAIVMAITDPDVPVYQGASMFLVPTDTPGVNIVRNVGLGGESEGEGSHAYVRYEDVRVPPENLLGGEGQAFVIAQTRLGGGRIHHAMRTIGTCQRAFDMMCERALSRQTQGEVLAKKQ